MVQRIVAPIMAVACGLAVLAGAVDGQAHDRGPAAPPEWSAFGSPGQAGAAARTIVISAGDQGRMRFTPAKIGVRRDETIRFVITNNGPVMHEFVIGNRTFIQQHVKEMMAMPDMDMNEANSVSLRPGQTKTLLWRFTKPGEFMFACAIPAHFMAGMTGRIEVR